MFDIEKFDIDTNKVIIGSPSAYGNLNELNKKSEMILSQLSDFVILSLNDNLGCIKSIYPDHLLGNVNDSNVSDSEVKKIIQWGSHFIIFWDGVELTRFVYEAIKSSKPTRVIPVGKATKVVNKDRGEEYDIYIGRRTPWGNPFIIDKDGDRDEVIKKYKKYFYETLLKDETKKQAILSLRGKVLGCHCKPYACHGDIISEYLNSLPDDI